MQVKFQRPLTDYKYLVMFDLATRVTGVCIWDIQKNEPKATKVLKVGSNVELPIYEMYSNLDGLFSELSKEGISQQDILIYQEAMPTQLRGGSSTVQTFLSLSRAHGALDLYTYLHSLHIYDYVGVYPASTHSYLKRLMGWDSKRKIEKEDIKNFVEREYSLSGLTYDEADAVFLAKTFIDVKWNKDIEEEIRVLKRHAKELKSSHGIGNCLEEEKRLESLKNK